MKVAVVDAGRAVDSPASLDASHAGSPPAPGGPPDDHGGARAPAAPSPRPARRMRLAASFAPEAGPQRFSGPVRMAIMVGAPLTLWGLVIVGVGAVAHAIGA